jgi:single-stranded DNA-binding protein
MAIHTQQSMSGFIASDPQLTFTNQGDARFYARVGQEHYTRNEDGSFTREETTFHDLVQYRKAAERAYAQFQKGDSFVAEGYVHQHEQQADGNPVEREEFVAKKIGHDTARTTYDVDRTARGNTPAADRSLAPFESNDTRPAPAGTSVSM